MKEQISQSSPLVSWRIWKILKNNILRSAVVNRRWIPGRIFRADSVKFQDKNNLQTGIHSWKTKEDASKYMSEWDFTCPFQSFCFGQIYNWGKIIECDKGYLSEFAYPKKLYVQNKEIVQELRNIYGCEVEVSDEGKAKLNIVIYDEISGTTAYDSSNGGYA